MRNVNLNNFTSGISWLLDNYINIDSHHQYVIWGRKLKTSLLHDVSSGEEWGKRLYLQAKPCLKKNIILYFAVSHDITELDESLIQVKAGKAEVSIIWHHECLDEPLEKYIYPKQKLMTNKLLYYILGDLLVMVFHLDWQKNFSFYSTEKSRSGLAE